ncbi:GNAT family N-acetyltransferase [Peribacillus sp. TH27]|uniref:GNAT family N-acetyltransferase n=1 Tax=Peribacillus sp. TH27 TaxID=2798484 RepID=UPI00313EC97B
MISTVTVRHPWNDPDHFSPYPSIWWFAVDPLYKQKGIGSTLLTWVEENVLRDQVKAPAVYLATADRHPCLFQFMKEETMRFLLIEITMEKKLCIFVKF